MSALVTATLTVGSLFAVSATASAATFAPAGDAFQMTADSVTFTGLGSVRSITCSNSSLSGTLASPAAGTAIVPASGIKFNNGGSTPCVFRILGFPCCTATLSAPFHWTLTAVSPTQVNINPVGGMRITISDPNGLYVCDEYANGSPVAQAGSWSNALSKLTFDEAGTIVTTSNDGGFCASTSYTVTASYQATNLTDPGAPITVQQ